MAVDTRLPMAAQNPSIFDALQSGIKAEREMRRAPILEAIEQANLGRAEFDLERAPVLAGQSDQMFQQRQEQGQMQNEQEQERAQRAQLQRRAQVTLNLAQQAKNLPEAQREIFKQTLDPAQLQAAGISPEEIAQFPTDDASIDNLSAQMQSFLSSESQGATAGQREFRSLTEGLSEDEIEKAKRIKLGLSGRATGSAVQTIAENMGISVSEVEKLLSKSKKEGLESTAGGQLSLEEAKLKVDDLRKDAINKLNAQDTDVSVAISDINKLLSNDLYKRIYGKGESVYPDLLRSQDGVDALKLRDRVVGLVVLAARGKLKGQGTITDSEQDILAKSATILKDPDISEKLALEEINRVKSFFESKGGNSSAASSNDFDFEYDPATGTFK